MKSIYFVIAAFVLAFAVGLPQRADAQVFDKSYSKSLILAGNGTDVTNTITLMAPTLSPLTPYTITLPTGPPTSTGLFLTSTTTGGLSWAPATATGSVLYNQTSIQNAATIAATNYLFNVGYASIASTNTALGAQITSNNTATTGSALQHSAVGLTINTYATTTGTPLGLAIVDSGADAADTIEANILLHTGNPHSLGYGYPGVSSEITTPDSSLILKQTADLYGSSILNLQNRTGSNGALFQTISNATHDSTDLVDWGFIPGHGVQSNIRLEARHQLATGGHALNEFLRSQPNITATAPEEFQYFFGTTGATPSYVFDIGESATLLERGNLGIGYGDNSTGGDTVNGHPLAKLDVHSPGTYYGGGSAGSAYAGAANILLSDTGTSSITAPYVGALEFQGTRDGISSFAAGSQGSTYINYTWPTSAPSNGQVLAVSATPGGSGTAASPYTVPLAWGAGSSGSAGSGMVSGATGDANLPQTNTGYYIPWGEAPAGDGDLSSASLVNKNVVAVNQTTTLGSLFAEISTAPTSGHTAVFTIYSNHTGSWASTGIVATITAGNLTATDNTDTYTVSAGDLISMHITTNYSPGTTVEASWGFQGPGTSSSTFANPMTSTGDIIYSSDNSGDVARLGVGTTAQFLGVSGGIPAWTSTLTSTSGLGATSADGLLIQNTTAATSGTPIQYSPRFHLSGTAYESTGSHSETDGWTIEDQPVNGTTSTTSNLVIADESNGLTAESVDAIFSSGGMLTLGTATGETGTLALGSAANADLTEFQPSTATPTYTYVYQMPSQAVAPPASEFLETGTPVLSGSTYTIPLQWNTAGGSSTGVNFNVTTAQTAAIAANNYLFNVGYTSAAADDSVVGAVITSTNTSSNNAGGNSIHGATGLTVNATAISHGSGLGNSTSIFVNATAGTGGTATGINLNVVGGTDVDILGTAGWSVSSAGAATFAGITDAGTTTINNTGTATTQIGNVAGFGNVTIGNSGTGAGSISLLGGTTGAILIGGTAQTGSITLGSSSGTNTVNVGTGAGTTTVNIATGGTGSVANTANIGSTTGASATTINAGTNGINLNGGLLVNYNLATTNTTYNATATDYIVILPALTTGNEKFTWPTSNLQDGRILIVANRNNGFNNWTTSANYNSLAGTTVATLTNGTSYTFVYHASASAWYQVQ